MTTSRPSNRAPLIAMTAVAVAAITALVWVLVVRPASSDDEATTAKPTASEPEPTTSKEPTTKPDPGPPTAFALTLAGDLVELQPQNGAVTRSIASNPLWQDSTLVISPDRAYAYVEAYDPTVADGPEWPGEIQRVSLAPSEPEGSATVETVVTAATSPAVSSDGATLAYLAIAPGETQSSVRSLTVMDLATGAVTASVPDDQCVECERRVTSPTWTPDSSTVILGLGWFDGFPSTSLVAVDPTSTPTLGAGRPVGPDNSGDVLADWFGSTAFTADGTLLVPAEEGSAAQWEARAAFALGDGPDGNQPTGHIAVVDPETGTVLSRIPVDWTVLSVAPEPGGTDILTIVGRPATDEVPALYRWDGSELIHIGDGYATVAW